MKQETIERIETALLDGPKTLGQLGEKLNKSPPIVSRQLEEMRKGGIIERWGEQGSYKIFMLKGSHPRKKFYRFGQAIGASKIFNVNERDPANIPAEMLKKLSDKEEKAEATLKALKNALKSRSPNLIEIEAQRDRTAYERGKILERCIHFAWRRLDKKEIERSLVFLGSAVMFALEKAGNDRVLFDDFCRGFRIGNTFLHESSAFKGELENLESLWTSIPTTDDFQVLWDKISKLKKKSPKARGGQPQALRGGSPKTAK